VEEAWHSSGGSGGGKGGGSAGATAGTPVAGTAGTFDTPDTAMGLHGSGSTGPITPGSRNSGSIPELPFASALLTSSDYRVDVGERTIIALLAHALVAALTGQQDWCC